MDDNNATVCLSEIKTYGFTDKLIKSLLPEPELKENPHYKKAAPMKLWKKDDVEKAMESEEFQRAKALKEKRSISVRKAVKTKEDKLLAQVKDQICKIKVRRINIDQLRKNAIKDRQDWYDYQSALREGEFFGYAYDADEPTINRWMVNYVRHHLTEYDKNLLELTEQTARKTGKDYAYTLFFNAIMSGIIETYPELEGECRNQIRRKEKDYQLKKWRYDSIRYTRKETEK